MLSHPGAPRTGEWERKNQCPWRPGVKGRKPLVSPLPLPELGADLLRGTRNRRGFCPDFRTWKFSASLQPLLGFFAP